jgi:hypothetical protein
VAWVVVGVVVVGVGVVRVGVVVVGVVVAVIPPVQQGSQYGPLRCGKLLGSGIQAESFTLLDSGDLQGKYAQYFGTGTVHGTFALTPQDTGPPSSTTTFANVAYTGTVDVLGGTGAFRKAAGKGKLACASTDGVHFSCTETVRIALAPVAQRRSMREPVRDLRAPCADGLVCRRLG